MTGMSSTGIMPITFDIARLGKGLAHSNAFPKEPLSEVSGACGPRTRFASLLHEARDVLGDMTQEKMG